MLDPEEVMAYMENMGCTGIRYSPNNNNVRGTCPYHQGNNPTAFVVNLETGYEVCYVCGASGQTMLRPVETNPHAESMKRTAKVYEDMSEIAEIMLEEMRLVYEGDMMRGHSPDVLSVCGAGFATNGPHKGKVVFPYRDNKGKLHGFKIRGFRKQDMVTDNYYNISSTFYMEHLWHEKYPIILVEGEWDAIRLYSFGIRNVMALGGSSLIQSRVDNIISKTSTIYMMLDNDDAGNSAFFEIVRKMGNLVNIYKMEYKRKDPDLLVDKREFWEAFYNATKH